MSSSALKPNTPDPKVIAGMKVWPTVIPQYELGHLQLMKKLDLLEKDMVGLWICSNYRTALLATQQTTHNFLKFTHFMRFKI